MYMSYEEVQEFVASMTITPIRLGRQPEEFFDEIDLEDDLIYVGESKEMDYFLNDGWAWFLWIGRVYFRTEEDKLMFRMQHL